MRLNRVPRANEIPFPKLLFRHTEEVVKYEEVVHEVFTVNFHDESAVGRVE
jgi:hypothetical protein